MNWGEPAGRGAGRSGGSGALGEWWWRVAVTARIGAAEHFAENPWRISLTTMWPRALLQCLFFTMIGRVVGGEDGQAYTFVGSVAIIMTLFTLAQICDSPMRDRQSATFYRLRAGRLPVPVIYVIRAWPVVAEAVVLAAVCVVAIGLATGQGELALQLLALFPIYLLMALTSAAAGLTAAAAGLFGRAGSDIIVGNLGMYLIIAASGAMIPPGRVGWLDAIGTVVPMRHGISATHDHLAGRPWLGDVLAELAVGASWAIAGLAVYSWLTHRVRVTDHDKVS